MVLTLTKHCNAHSQSSKIAAHVQFYCLLILESWNVRNFLSITVSHEVQGLEFGELLRIAAIRGPPITPSTTSRGQGGAYVYMYVLYTQVSGFIIRGRDCACISFMVDP